MKQILFFVFLFIGTYNLQAQEVSYILDIGDRDFCCKEAVLVSHDDNIVFLDMNTYWFNENKISVGNPLLYLVNKRSNYEIVIYNQKRNVVKRVSPQKKSDGVIVNIDGINPDRYYLEIIKGKNTYRAGFTKQASISSTYGESIGLAKGN